MLEVVFSDSTRGSMMAAKNFNRRLDSPNAVFYIGEEPSEEHLQNMLQKMQEGEAIDGTSSDVIGVVLDLDIGDISGDEFGDERKSIFLETHRIPFEEEENSNRIIEADWKRNQTDYNRLMEQAQNGGDIRIWRSDAPYSTCGYYYIVSALKDYDCKVTEITLPHYLVESDNTVKAYTSWLEIYPGIFHRFLPYEREITRPERSAIASEWVELKKQNASLRAVVNGKLISVPEDFYDNMIRACIPEDEFMLGQLISDLYHRYQINVSDWWYRERINKMIKNGELEIVHDDIVYQRILLKIIENNIQKGSMSIS